MVLQSGDLFHFNKPSKKALFDAMRTLRLCCLGDKPVELEVLNHGTLSTDPVLDHPNWYDPNINVAIPVFAISGNHDDSGGHALLSPMDILSVSGLLNYYGRVTENDRVTITPVLLRKGNTKLALYGLSNVRDERLFRTFREGGVKFLRPKENPEEWFSILAVHQNHASHSETNYLPESFLPDFLNIVIWGHEHECLIDPVRNPNKGFSVIQPGSSVATSLSEGEAVRKQIGIIKVRGLDFELEKIPLATVRPFKMETVMLSADSFIRPGPDNLGEVVRWMTARVDKMIEQAQNEWLAEQTNAQIADCPLPLIRLRVEYSGGYEVENPARFSNRFIGRVANTKDVVQYFRKKSSARTKPGAGAQEVDPMVVDTDMIDDEDGGLVLDRMRVQSLVQEYLRSQQLEMLPEKALGDAIDKFVEKEDRQALKAFVDKSCEFQIEDLVRQGVTRDEDILRAFIAARDSLPAESLLDTGVNKSTKQAATKPSRPTARGKQAAKGRRAAAAAEDIGGADEDNVNDEVLPSTRTSRRPASRRAAAKSAAIVVESDLSDDDFEIGGEDLDEDDVVRSDDPDAMEEDEIIASPPPKKYVYLLRQPWRLS